MGIHREEKQMYGLAHCAVHHNFWTIVPLELILPHDFRQRGKNLGEETSRQPLQSFLRTSLSPKPTFFFASSGSWRMCGTGLTLCVLVMSKLKSGCKKFPSSQAPQQDPCNKGDPALQKSSKNIISILSVILKWRANCALKSSWIS